MNVWLLFFIFCIFSLDTTQSTNYVIQPYTYYFQIHRYKFGFDFNPQSDITSNDVYIEHNNDIHIHVLFHLNTSSYIFNINHNLSLDYDYDPDWNEIDTLIISSPSEDHTLAVHNSTRRRLYTRPKRRGRYIGVSHARSFHDAERVCRHRYGGELASIGSSNKNNQIRSLCKKLSKKGGCWIGLRRPFRRWTNGKRVRYKKWSPGEPNNAGRKESCTEIYRNGRWNDNQCHRTKPFICETARIKRGKSHVAVGMALSWDSANEYCHRRFDTELATVRSGSNNRAVRRVCRSVAKKGSCWIGLERPFKKWQDGKRVKYTRWNPGEPNNHGKGEACTEMYSNRKWNDLPCRSGRFFVCNYKGTDNKSGRRKRRRRRSKTGRRRRRRSRRWVRGRKKRRKVRKEAGGKTLHMRCSRGRIETLKASYGRNCKAGLYNNQLATLQSKCNGKSRCRYKIASATDPAYGCAKDYQYTYRCKWRKRRRRRSKRKSTRSRGRRTTRRRRRRSQPRFREWKCSHLRFDDYERKECLRRRAGTLRRFGRRKARRRWRKRLEGWATKMKARGYRGFTGMGRGFRRGFDAGKKSVMGGMRSNMNGGLAQLGAVPQLQLPRIRVPQYKTKGVVPVPPRIQLIDLPPGHPYRGRGRRGRGRGSRRLGTGYNIGMTGHHKKYTMPTLSLQLAMMNGATKKDLKVASKLTEIGFKQAEKDAVKKAKKMGFGDFKGFDGFGSGRLQEDLRNEGLVGRDGKKSKRFTDGWSFGIGEKSRRKRRLMIDEEDVDILDYGDMKNEKKCVVYEYDGVYEICVGHNFVEIKQFISMIEREVNEIQSPQAAHREDEEFTQFVAFEGKKYESMTKKESMDRMYNDYTHYLEIYEFIFEDNENSDEQCFTYLEPFVICRSVDAENESIFYIQYDEITNSFNFSNDNHWNEINQIIGNNDDSVTSIEKCVSLFETKMCVYDETENENESKFRVLMYKTA